MKRTAITLLTLLLAVSLALSSCTKGDHESEPESDAQSFELSEEPSNEESDVLSEVSEEVSEEISEEISEESAENSEESYVSEDTESQPDDESSNETVSQEEIETDYENKEPYLLNGMIISGTRVMEQYGGTAKAGAAFATNYVNAFREYLNEDVNLYASALPLACAFYAPDKYASSKNNIVQCFTGFSESLENVTYVDILNAMMPHADEDLYFRTDHHWNALGAYYAAQEMAKVMGVPFAELNEDNFTENVKEKMYGSFYTFTEVDGKKLKMITENPDVFIWYEPKAEYTVTYYTPDYFKASSYKATTIYSSAGSYSKFLGGDSYGVEITTSCDNGRALMIIKDSYGNALPQYLISSFSKIYVVDIRKFKLGANQFIEEHGITDVFVGLSAFSTVGSNGKCLKNLMK